MKLVELKQEMRLVRVQLPERLNAVCVSENGPSTVERESLINFVTFSGSKLWHEYKLQQHIFCQSGLPFSVWRWFDLQYGGE